MASSRPGRRALRRTVWLAALGLAAASAPTALASEGVLDAAVPQVPNGDELAITIIEQAGLPQPGPVPPLESLPDPSAAAQAADEEPVPTGANAAAPPAPVVQPSQEAAPDAPPVAAPEPPPAEAAPEPVPDAPPPQAVQQQPANVNVSVRIDSPGDDGAVTQVNVAGTAAPEPQPEQYQPEPPRYQPAVAPDAPATHGDDATAPAWEWTWEWSCGGDAPGEIALPADAASQTWTWNWNWNCGENRTPGEDSEQEIADGYQARATQYRPVNVNVSIRINSPGSNGPVVQTNLAVAIEVPRVLVASAAAAPIASTPVFASVPATEPPAAAPEPASAGSAAPERDDCCLLAEPRGAPDADAPESIVVIDPLSAPRDLPASAPTAADAVAVTARLELRARRAQTPAAAPQRAQARPAGPGRRPAEREDRAAATQQSGLGLAPVGAPEQTLPFAALVLVAFAFASANSSWAAVRSRPTPEAEPDEPPDRPG